MTSTSHLAPDEQDLLAHAERHHGVFTRATARRFNVPDHLIDSRIRANRWELVQPATVRVVGAPYTYEAEVLAAVLAATEQRRSDRPRLAAASHATAAALVGLQRHAADSLHDPVEICVDGTALPELWWDTVVHRTTVLPSTDLTEVDGIPCTAGPRMAIDLAAGLEAQVGVLRLVDDVIGGRIATREEQHARAVALSRGRRHAGLIGRITAPGCEDRFHSWLERTACSTFRRRGLPEARWNAAIYAGTDLVARADVLFEPWNVVVELDGLRFHTTPAQLVKDKQRDRRLAIMGYLVLRYTYWEIVERPSEVVAEIRQALAGRGA